MFAALLTTLLFSISAICGHRTATRLGGVEANFWRIVGAAVFLAIWANTFGTGTAGKAFSLFILSGLAGIGLGDTAYFQALPLPRQPADRPAHPVPHRSVRRADRMALAWHAIEPRRR